MSIQLEIYRVIEFYDVPQVFLAYDIFEVSYLCAIISIDEVLEYLAVPISRDRLSLFLSGTLDLREATEFSEQNRWYIASFDTEGTLVAEENEWSEELADFLPDPGFYCDNRQIENEELVREVYERRNPVIQLTFNEGSGQDSMDFLEIASIGSAYQALLRDVHRRVIKDVNPQYSAASHNYQLRLYGTAPGSFKLYMEASADTNLFGETALDKTLERVTELLTEYKTDAEIIEMLQNNTGHPVARLKTLLERVQSYNLRLKHSWASPVKAEIAPVAPSVGYIARVLNLLHESHDLSKEIVEITGYVLQADVEKGTWRIQSAQDEKKYKGESRGISLEGITLETVQYTFTCEEIVEEYNVSKKEKTSLVLIGYHKA